MISKNELRDRLRITNRQTFIRKLKVLCTDPECPFSWEQIKKVHLINEQIAQFILNNL